MCVSVTIDVNPRSYQWQLMRVSVTIDVVSVAIDAISVTIDVNPISYQ